MRLQQLENIRVVLAEPDADLRRDIKASLIEAGMTNVLDTDSLDQVRSVIEEDRVELIIGDTTLKSGSKNESFNQLVLDMRHREFGVNPFIMTITMVDAPHKDSIRDAINSGTDHILAKPINIDTLANLLMGLTMSRKRFVVTTDYIGPDRRSGDREGTMKIPQIEVPNPLRQRMTGQMKESTLRRTIDTAWSNINEQKVERHSFQIGWLLDRIIPEIGLKEDRSVDFNKNVNRLISVSQDMSRRVNKTRFAHIREMTMTMTNLITDAVRSDFPPEDVRLMLKLSEIISNSFDPERFSDDGTQARDHTAYIDNENKKASPAA